MKSLFEEHLRGKNRSYTNLRFLGHYFYDMENNMQYAPVCIDYTSRDGKVISENNLYLVGFTGSDTHWRVEGMASGEWGMSAGYYPNVAKFNDRYVVWTTRNDTHMKLSEDKSSSDPNATETNYLYKYRVTCQSGATYTWQAMDGAGVFVLSKEEQPIRVVPLDASYNEVAAFAFDKVQLQCVDVHTITEQIW